MSAAPSPLGALRLALLLLAAALPVVSQAGTREDLLQAADPDLPEPARMAAFERLVQGGTTDLSVLGALASDTKADSRQRWVAVRALGRVQGDRAEQILVGLIADPEPAMRAAAVQALGDLGQRRHAPRATALLDDPAIIVRASAAAALCQIGDEAAVAALSEALFARDSYYRGSSLWVRRHYVEAIGCIGRRGAVPALLRALDDNDPAVSEASLAALAKVAGFDYAEGRSPQEAKDAWRRWAQSQIK